MKFLVSSMFHGLMCFTFFTDDTSIEPPPPSLFLARVSPQPSCARGCVFVYVCACVCAFMSIYTPCEGQKSNITDTISVPTPLSAGVRMSEQREKGNGSDSSTSLICNSRRDRAATGAAATFASGWTSLSEVKLYRTTHDVHERQHRAVAADNLLAHPDH